MVLEFVFFVNLTLSTIIQHNCVNRILPASKKIVHYAKILKYAKSVILALFYLLKQMILNQDAKRIVLPLISRSHRTISHRVKNAIEIVKIVVEQKKQNA